MTPNGVVVMLGQGSRKRPPAAARGGADFLAQPENWGDRASWGQTYSRTTLARSEQTRAHPVSAQKKAVALDALQPSQHSEKKQRMNGVNRLRVIDSKNSLDEASLVIETEPMPTHKLAPVHLRRIDLARNMRRFYCLTVQPTLFGGASLIRDWGRIGTRGQTIMETFNFPADAANALMRIERSKKRRGYRETIAGVE
jgi:predicted DNA-binding WGR domain protein